MPKATTLPVLRAVPTFYTKDNTAYTDRKGATIHELGLQIREALLPHFRDDGDLKKICLHLARNHSNFKNIYDKLGRAHRMAE